MAAREVFVDTAGFLALWDASDEHHRAAVRIKNDLVTAGRSFLTSDYVVDESATLLLMRHSHRAAADFLETIEKTSAVRIEWISPDRFRAAASLFRRHHDKTWSFTDCVSFVTMRELQLRDALTTDRHFTQAGFIPLLAR
ncbi:MAG TPA: PIN domain-containing protein [Gemmatimonadaceae bacterium]|nr:PIN domain-containing protein [Gemmatimonadaceae bacterium]